MKAFRFLSAVLLLVPALAQAQYYYPAPAPTTGVSRASFTEMVMSRAGYPSDGTYCFIDVQNQSFAPAVCGAKQRGIITGDASGKFRPNDPILFVEAAAVAIRATGTTVPYDVVWYRPYIDILVEWDAFPSTVTNILYPISSSQAQELIDNVFSADHGNSSQSSGSTSDDDDDGILLTVTSSDTTADIDDTVTYTIKVKNADDHDLHNLLIKAYIDNDFDYVSSTDGGSYDNDRVTWDDIDVDEDETETITLKVRVANSADDNDKLTLRVTVEDSEVKKSLTVDEGSSDNDDDDLHITISDSPASAEPGDTVTYTIRLRNDGNDDITTDVRAALDTDMEFVSASDSGDEDDDEVLWDNFRIDEDEEEVLTLKVRIDDNADEGDTVRLEVRAGGEEDTETTEIDEDNSSSSDDFEISITDSPDPVDIGETITYQITVKNNTNGDTDVDLVVELDTGMSYYSSNNGAERSGTEVRWRDLEISDDADRTVMLMVKVNSEADEGDTLRLHVTARDAEEEETTRVDE